MNETSVEFVCSLVYLSRCLTPIWRDSYSVRRLPPECNCRTSQVTVSRVFGGLRFTGSEQQGVIYRQACHRQACYGTRCQLLMELRTSQKSLEEGGREKMEKWGG